MDTALFLFAVFAVLLTVNGLRKPSPPESRFPPIWLPAMLTAELTPLWILADLLAGWAVFARHGTSTLLGEVTMGLLGLSLIALFVIAGRTRAVVDDARRLSGDPAPAGRGLARFLTFRHRLPDEVELLTELEYAPGLTLDVYRRQHLTGPAPALVYVHGGGWTGGAPHKQARALFHLLAQRGWVVATIRYPLSPAATFPDHLDGVYSALDWMRRDPAGLGIDPDRIALAGGSAGGHLAALAALSSEVPVAACAPLYGVFDFFNRHNTRHDWPVIPRAVMKTGPDDDPGLYRAASPIDRVGPDAPPFFVIHGTHDSLVPPAESRYFVEALRAASRQPVHHWEVPGGQHAFDALASPRSRATATVIASYLDRTAGLVDSLSEAGVVGSRPMATATAPLASKPRSRTLRTVYLVLGIICLGFAYLSFLPGIPTFDFVILAAFFFARSSDRFHDWLVNHPIFGKIINGYRGGLTLRVKIAATLGILTSLAFSGLVLTDSRIVRTIIGLAGIYAVWFVWTRPRKHADRTLPVAAES